MKKSVVFVLISLFLLTGCSSGQSSELPNPIVQYETPEAASAVLSFAPAQLPSDAGYTLTMCTVIGENLASFVYTKTASSTISLTLRTAESTGDDITGLEGIIYTEQEYDGRSYKIGKLDSDGKVYYGAFFEQEKFGKTLTISMTSDSLNQEEFTALFEELMNQNRDCSAY
ncbi:MAG: hypothetical protein ACOYB8_09880 [Eubacteriaceae bacterium]|jgi:hypothetical protein